MIRAIILTGLGGGLGSILRYLTSVVVARYFQSNFPLATFLVNITGSLIIGLIIGMIERYHFTGSDLKFFLIIGFCGGFTTFSAFASENYNLFSSGNSYTAFLYMAASILISLFAVWLGLSVSRL